MASPTLTVSIEIKNPSNNETTRITKGPFTVSQTSLPMNLLQAITGMIGTLILGLNSNPKATCITPIMLLDDNLMYNSDKFKVNPSQAQPYLQTTIKTNEGNFAFLPSNTLGTIEIIRKHQPTILQSMLTQESYENLTPSPSQQNI